MPVHPPRWARIVLLVEAALLLAVGAAGLVLGLVGEGDEAEVLFLRPNLAHSALLLVTGVLALAAAARLRPLLWFCAAQVAVYLLLLFVGAGQAGAGEDRDSVLLVDGAENALHAALVVVAFSVGLGVAALTAPARARARARRAGG